MRRLVRSLVVVVALTCSLAVAVPAGSAPARPAAGHTAADRISPGALGPGPTARYLEALHQLFLGRSASAAELGWWSVSVHEGVPTRVTAAWAASDEWAGARIDDLYQQVFGRPADGDGRAYWVDAIAGGLRLEDVAAHFYGSHEYWMAVGATNAGFVDALYRSLLGRDADDGGRSYWTRLLDSGLARTAVAAEFFASIESRQSRVRARYREVLAREPDASGLRYWSEQLLRLGDVILAAELAASAEFHLRATGVGPAWVRTVAVGPGTTYPLAASWRTGCPVHHRDLVAVEFPHWTPAGARTTGVLIVRRDVAGHVAYVVRTMFGTAFPLTSARPIDDFGGDDDRSMAADNSSAFNCRTVAGTTTWSQHAYGTAVDLNPVRNPYVKGSTVEPPAGTGWLDRTDIRPGMLVEGGPAVVAFDRLGWGWGGRWQSAKDYQHFSVNGR